MEVIADGLYHADIWLPEQLNKPILFQKERYIWSHHAREKPLVDKIAPWLQLKLYPVEVQIDAQLPIKTLYRGPYDQIHDLCVVVRTQTPPFVVTLWLIKYWDKHQTLVRERYIKRP